MREVNDESDKPVDSSQTDLLIAVIPIADRDSTSARHSGRSLDESGDAACTVECRIHFVGDSIRRGAVLGVAGGCLAGIMAEAITRFAVVSTAIVSTVENEERILFVAFAGLIGALTGACLGLARLHLAPRP